MAPLAKASPGAGDDGGREAAQSWNAMAMTQPQAEELRQRIDHIEEAYEFMLAYAAQGLTGDEAGGAGAQLRDVLGRCHDALHGLPQLLKTLVQTNQRQPAASYGAFIDVVERDAHSTQAALQLVLAQRAISSQLIDNLNAWMHLRALLTDLFVIDELLRG
jgi:hypothetical protein